MTERTTDYAENINFNMQVLDTTVGEKVNVYDSHCPRRSCYWARRDPGSFTQGKGYSFRSNNWLCGNREIRGCPTPLPEPEYPFEVLVSFPPNKPLLIPSLATTPHKALPTKSNRQYAWIRAIDIHKAREQGANKTNTWIKTHYFLATTID